MGVLGHNLEIPIVGGAPEIEDLQVRDMPLKIGSIHDRKVIGAKGRDIRVEILERATAALARAANSASGGEA